MKKSIQLIKLCLLIALASVMAPQVRAEAPITGDTIVLAEAQEIGPAEMGELRAGFIDPAGFIFRFAVDIRSKIDGALMFVRSLVVEPTAKGHFEATQTAQIIPENIPEGTKVEVVDEGKKVVVSDEKGAAQTTLINQSPTGNFSSVVLNTANNRHVAQTVNVDLVLQNVKTILDQVAVAKNMHAPAGLNQAATMHRVGFGF